MKQVGEEQQEITGALNDRAVWTICCNILNFLFVMPPRSNISASRIRYAVRFRWWSGT